MRNDRKNILVTTQLDGQQIQYARVMGLEPLIEPALEFEFPEYWDRVLRTINDHPKADWVFSSSNAVKALERMRRSGLQVPPNTTVYAVGRKTADALADLGLEATVPRRQKASGLAERIAEEGVDRVIWFRGNRARRELPEILAERGVEVLEVEVYKTKVQPVNLPDRHVDGILFYSPSAVEGFSKGEGFKGELPELFAIGPTTAQALREAADREPVVAGRPDTRVLLKKVSDTLFDRKPAT
ncbi:MAG: uroporphyrinogen-III synthase [Balneolaceae bacterium]|nr:uroporphyrinogen-III synthase [Balneolaceae bacterium]